MATTTQNDNRAKFLELRKQGISVADARNQTYGPPPVVPDATPEPTTPVAPVTPPTAPTVTGVDGQQFVQAPVDPTTGLSKPIEPVAQPTQTEQDINKKYGGFIQDNGINSVQPINAVTEMPATPKADPTPGITQDAFQQAKSESEKIKAQNDAIMAQNKQKSDLAREDLKLATDQKTAEAKQVQDQANIQLANNEGAILNTLKVGGIIPEQVKSSPYYKTALATYNKMQQYSTYSIGQLTTALNQGNILPGTSLYNEMMKDPALKTKLTEAQIYTSSKPTDKTAMYENASTDILSSNPKTANMLADGVITVEEYNQATNNDAIMAKAKEVEEKTNKYNALYAEYEAIPEKIRADFPGSPFADAMIADAQNAKYKAVILARGEMNSADGTLTELKAQASSLFETNLKLYQDQQIEANKIKAEQRATENALALSQAQFEQKLAQQTQLTNDPTTAIGGVIKQFSDLGIVGDRDLAWHVAEQKRLGMTLPEYTKKMIEDFKAKPEYQQALAKKANEGVSFQTIGDKVYKVQNGQLVDTGISATKTPEAKAPEFKVIGKNADGTDKYGWVNATNQTITPYGEKTSANIPSGKSLFDVLGKNVGTYEGNRGYDLAGALGDPLPAGGNWTVKSVDTAGEQVGSIFIGGKGKKPYGNTVVMQDENGNEIRYSHLQDIGVKPGDVLGFGDIVGTRGNTGNVKGANGETLTAEQLKAGRGAHVDVEIKSNGKLLSNADQVTFLKGLKAGGGTSSASLPLYRAYMEENKLPSKDALKGLGMTSEQFTNNADAGYDSFLKTKAKEISDTYPTLDIEYTGNYAGNSATQKEKLNESVTKIGDIDSRISQLKSLFEKNGTEVWPTKDKAVMESLRKQIILKAKEVENLGVLNGPDLGILEDLLPSTTGFMSGMFSLDSNTMAKINNIQNNYRNDAKTKAINYGARLKFEGNNATPEQTISSADLNYKKYEPKN